MTTKAQQSALDNALVAPENQRVIGHVLNMRIILDETKEPIISCVGSSALKSAYLLPLSLLKITGQEFDEPPSKDEALSFICELGHSGEIKYITDVIVDHLHQQGEILTCRKGEKKMTYENFCIYHHKYMKTSKFTGVILNKSMANQAMLDSVAYKTYYAIASGEEPPKSKKTKRKSDSTISYEETPSKKKPTKAKKDADRGKSLDVLLEVALSKVAQAHRPIVTKRSKVGLSHSLCKVDQVMELIFNQGFLMSNNTRSWYKMKGTGAKPGVPDVPKYDSESNKESWGDSGEEDDDEDDTEDDEGNDDGDDSDGNDDDDDDNNGNDDDNDDDDDDSDRERIKSDRDENPNLNQFIEEHEEEEEENVDEFTDKEDDVNNANDENKEELDDGEELYKDVNVNLRKEDVEMTNVDQGGADQHNVSQESGSSVSSDFTEKLLNFENVSSADNEIASLMDTTVRTEEPSGQTSTLFNIPITVIPITIPPPPHFFNPLPQQTTPTPKLTTSEVTTAFPALQNFASVFRFNDRVTNLERDLSEIKQVDQYDQAISLIPAIVDRYMDNKLGEAIHKAIQSHNA
ncbi:hypothetical protein Tco_0205780 [Tanacetum coccineum]